MLGILVALIKIAELATVEPGIGMYAVGALVVLLRRDHGHFRPARGLEAGRVGRRRERHRGPWPVSRAACEARAMTAHRALTAAQAGLVSCETCALAVAARRSGRAGLLPALRRQARVAPPPLHPVHLGARHRRGDLLHPGQRAAGAEHDDARVRRFRHHHGRSGASLHHGILAARAHRAGRERDGPARQAGRAHLSADHGAARLARGSRERTRLYRMVEFIGRWSMLDVFVDTFTVALVQLQPLMSVAARAGRAVLRGRGRADDDRRGVL